MANTITGGTTVTTPSSEEVALCNSALLRAGITKQITSLDGTDNLSVTCNSEYEQLRDFLLEEHPWQFATKYDDIDAADATNPEWYWSYRYALPADCILLLGLEAEGIPYEQADDGFIYTNEGAPLKIKYISKETAVSKMPNSFKQALITKLAAVLALGLTKDARRVEYLESRYDRLIADARFADSGKRSAQPLDSSAYQDARYIGPDAVDNHGDLNY